MSKYIGDVSAYAYAVSKGYTGTEEEFAELMADYADVGQRAEDAAESALNSKTAAQTAAQTATTKASEASTSATNASSSASAASASASAASGSATSAANSATAASGSATSAAGSATTASTKASEASTSATAANTAKIAAEAAQSAAETAQEAAEEARDEAETTAQSISASAAQIATNAADIAELKSEFSELPTDGVAGNSKQLLSENGTDNTEPYMFRAVPVNADRAELDAVVGGTVAWNQMASLASGDWLTPSLVSVSASDKNINITSASSNSGAKYARIKLEEDHIYFANAKINSTGTSIRFGHYNDNTYQNATVFHSDGEDDKDATLLFKATAISGTTPYLGGYIATAAAVGTSGVIKNAQCFDLTAMFGSTIADYIYSLEQSTAGAGVAFFRRLFPKDYYPYDAGTLKSVEGVSSHDMVGFNQFDGAWENGYYDTTTGAKQSSTTWQRCVSKIPCIPNTAYHLKQEQNGSFANVLFYDSDGSFVGYVAGGDTASSGLTLTTPSNAYYFAFYRSKTTNNGKWLNVNLSDPTKNGTYEPYVKHTYPLDSTLTLRGIPKLADGKLSYDGDRYLPDGTVERRYGIRTYQSGDESLADAITDGTNTVYKLTTMTIEESTPYRQLQICDPNGTEEFVSTGIVPVGHETRYPENLRAKIEGLPWDFSSLIAPTEKTTTASRNYTTGSLLIMGNVLYKATANIANGGTITPNTNVTATTLSEVISALQ